MHLVLNSLEFGLALDSMLKNKHLIVNSYNWFAFFPK